MLVGLSDEGLRRAGFGLRFRAYSLLVECKGVWAVRVGVLQCSSSMVSSTRRILSSGSNSRNRLLRLPIAPGPRVDSGLGPSPGPEPPWTTFVDIGATRAWTEEGDWTCSVACPNSVLTFGEMPCSRLLNLVAVGRGCMLSCKTPAPPMMIVVPLTV
eukprot:1145719-Amorphochlora_amoeboformis.AAC.1